MSVDFKIIVTAIFIRLTDKIKSYSSSFWNIQM